MRAEVKRVAEQYIDLPAIRRVTAIWILLLLATASAAYAQTDTVTTATGETIIGEIIKRGEGRPHDLHALFGLRFQDQVGPGGLDRQRAPVPDRDVRRAGACPAR